MNEPPGNRKNAGFISAIICIKSARSPLRRPLNVSRGNNETLTSHKVPGISAETTRRASVSLALGRSCALNFFQFVPTPLMRRDANTVPSCFSIETVSGPLKLCPRA